MAFVCGGRQKIHRCNILKSGKGYPFITGDSNLGLRLRVFCIEQGTLKHAVGESFERPQR